MVGDHGVHERGRVLADHRDGGVDVAAADRVALLRHGGARSAAVRERLVDLADLGLHHQLDVHAELAERPADQPEERPDLGDVVPDGVPGDDRLLQAELGAQFRPGSPSPRSRVTPACRRRRRTPRRAPARAAAPAARGGARRREQPRHLVAERDGDGLLQVAATDHRGVPVLAGEARQTGRDRGQLVVDQVERLPDLQHRGGVGDVLGRGAPVAVLAEAVTAEGVELVDHGDDRIADALGLPAQLDHVDLVEAAVADDLVGRLLRDDAELPLHLGQGGLDVEVVLRSGSRRTRPSASRRC